MPNNEVGNIEMRGEDVTTPLSPHYQYYKSIFDKYDRDGDGFINIRELDAMIQCNSNYDNDIPRHVANRIHEMSDTNRDGRLDYNEFIEMINNPKFQYFFGDYVNRYINFVVPRRCHRRLKRKSDDDDDGEDRVDGQYEDEYSCWPPALGMLTISIIEIIFFSIDEGLERNSTNYASGPIATLFLYDPFKRQQIWRFLSYMFVHIGYLHLVVNLGVQILIGIPLEMVHGWWRVLSIYAAGVVAGSLATSIADPFSKLAGASGGVYSIITAHVATIIMNWAEMTFPLIQLSIFLIVIVCDVGQSIYNRYYLDIDQHIGYVAHFAGAIAGFLVGINVLRNFNVTHRETIIWYCAITLYVGLMATAVIMNCVWTDHFPK